MKILECLIVGEENCARDRVLCRLNKSLYGLKQAPRCWDTKFNSFVKKFNPLQSEADHCIYHGELKRERVYMALFADDGLIACKSSSVIKRVIEYL